MDSIKSDMLKKDQEWLQLRMRLVFDHKSVQDNKERIRTFFYKDGVHIMLTCCTGISSKQEELRRMVSAELMEHFTELMYHSNDLDNEMDYPIFFLIKSKVSSVRSLSDDEYEV
ncbi:MAG: hypothetical protein J1E98_00340 [Lachnospiraceae bacterium]|nr:hypothetical protein [Lachnospiraceae bacterium]